MPDLKRTEQPTPGRMSSDMKGRQFQDEWEYERHCADRAANGYNSGMGEIFRKVADVNAIQRKVVLRKGGTKKSEL